MTLHASLDDAAQIDRLAKAAAALGYEIVDVAGFLDLVEAHARDQKKALVALSDSAAQMVQANEDVTGLVSALSETSDQALRDVKSSAALVRDVSDKTREVAGWVGSVTDRTADVGDTLKAVKANNSQIATISAQVNTLAINAKIEAARAGDAGRGFAVVADAINDLSQKTKAAASQISENIEALTGWIDTLGQEARGVSDNARTVLKQSSEIDTALSRMEGTIEAEHEQTCQIARQTEKSRASVETLQPAVRRIDETVRDSSDGIEKTHARMTQLVDASELIVQSVGALGGRTPDAPFIDRVQEIARSISKAFDVALDSGEIGRAALFDRTYTPIADTDPVQVLTRNTEFLDRLLPGFLEPQLQFHPGVVFCAAVDTNGYLPVHNRKFAQPQGDDPVWNMANCRNRRIFDDRVGLKAGRSTAPFLLQVYRRDMGGGTFKIMKDLSAPIRAGGQHWGGVRLAYAL